MQVEGARFDQFFAERIKYLNHQPAPAKPHPAYTKLSLTVERNFIANLPKNLSRLDVNTRKAQFIATLLPLILRVNELIMEDREQIISLMLKTENGERLSELENLWLAEISKNYEIDPKGVINFPELLNKVDQIPPSLALAQGAIESGWGTSRFATLGNALYGQWTWSDSDSAGLIPLGREEGQKHRIKSFPYLIQSVAAYALNLNSHSAYEEFRDERANLHLRGEGLNGIALSSSLLSYSTRREEYVTDLQTIIYSNQLSAFDVAHLEPSL